MRGELRRVHIGKWEVIEARLQRHTAGGPLMPFLKRVASPQKRAWTVKDWCAEVSLSRATAYRLMADGHLKFVTIGKARRITTSPKDFLASLEASSAA